MWIIGHRGAAGLFPENTLLSFERALAFGVDWVELDIRLVDAALVVFHDDKLDRTTNGTGSIYAADLVHLRRLDAGRGERIPLLEEVMHAIDARCGLNIEIKQEGLTAALAALLEKELARQPRWNDRVMISSFHSGPLREFHRCNPGRCLIAALSDHNFDSTLRLALDIDAFSINVSLAELTRAIVRDTHAHARKLLVYTVNGIEDIARCRALGVDGIFTDFPDRAIAFLRE